jgi:hypothetical protein
LWSAQKAADQTSWLHPIEKLRAEEALGKARGEYFEGKPIGLPYFEKGGKLYPQQGIMSGALSPTPIGTMPVAKLEGAADINLKIEVTNGPDTVVRKVEQSIAARGALRADTGVSMPIVRQ